ncbi:MAG: peptide-methionine (S)-S-oxide reductase MsrA [Corynebacterium sp.]|nr:peptide-methionine (S)-S-oxide reductase MsrA [Corynebacterium sp.]
MGWLFDPPTAQLVPAEEALKGGEHPVLVDPQPHEVFGTSLVGPWPQPAAVVYLGLGCYWGAEKMFWETPGVISTAVGFAGGHTLNPTYREVCTGQTNHTEIVQVVYDPTQLEFADIVKQFFEAHDPTQGFRQGNDVGTQYRSAIYTSSPEQAVQAQEIAGIYAQQLADAGYGQLTTEIMPLADTPTGNFFYAEAEHQQYLKKVPNGYCPHHSTGVACNIPE